jgi:MYXO-CTERM domain-containing protein
MKKMLSALALAAGTLLVAAPASAAIVVSFVPAANHINIGDSVSVQMNISGLDAEILSAFDINMLFDESVLDNNLVTHSAIPTQFGAFPDDSYIDTTFGVGDTGVIDGSYLDDATLAGMQANAFTVLTFGFIGAGNGSTFVNLGPNLDFQRNFVGLRFGTLDVTVNGACIAVGTGDCGGGPQIPEPASFGLAALALLAAGAAGRARRRS